MRKEEWIVILEVAIEVLKELLSGLSDSLTVHTGFRPEKQLKKKKYLTIEFGWH